MTPPESPHRGALVRRRVVIAVIALALLIVLANAHLVFVAVATQPQCVAPPADDAGAFRPAKPAC